MKNKPIYKMKLNTSDYNYIQDMEIEIRKDKNDYVYFYGEYCDGFNFEQSDWDRESFIVFRDNIAIGFLILTFFRIRRTASVAFYISNKYRHEGAGSFAFEYAIDRVLNFHGFNKIEAFCNIENKPSYKTCIKYLKKEGEIKDGYFSCGDHYDKILFGLTKKDYQLSKKK